MGNENLVYYSSLILLATMLLGFGAWVDKKIPGNCTHKYLQIGIRGMLATGSVLITASIGILICSVFCVRNVEGLTGTMSFFMGSGALAGVIFSGMVAIQSKKCLSSSDHKSVAMWVGIIMALLIVFTTFSWGFSIYKLKEKRKPIALKKKIIQQKRRKKYLEKQAIKDQERRDKEEQIERSKAEVEALRKKIESEEREHNKPSAKYERYVKMKEEAEKAAELKIKNRRLKKIEGLIDARKVISDYRGKKSPLKVQKRIEGLKRKFNITGRLNKKQLINKIDEEINKIESNIGQINPRKNNMDLWDRNQLF